MPTPLHITATNNGLTNSSRFRTLDNEVKLHNAINYYVDDMDTIASNLEFLINNPNENYSIEQLLSNVTSQIYSVYESYKDLNAI